MEILKKYYPAITSLIVFIIYLITIAPSVIQIDSGELAAVQATLGIAHPTGYPLFTITGYIFSLIPLPFSTIYQLNILAAVWCAAGVFMFSLTAKSIIENSGSFQKEKNLVARESSKAARSKKAKANKPIVKEKSIQVGSDIPIIKKIIAIIAGTMILAFSKTFWFQSTSVEVYSLHIFLILLIIYFLIKAYLKSGNDLKEWLIFAVVLALGFTNHMTTLLILPGTAYLFFNKLGFKKDSFKKLGLMLLLFFPVLILVYSYLPVRASQDVLLNWGNPIGLERILRHISGKQYQVWLFSSTEAAKKQFVYFFESLFNEFNISIFICLAGLAASFIAARKAFIFLIITFVSTVLYSINYDIADIDAYFILAYITLSFFAVFGTIKLLSLLKFKKYSYAISTGLISVFILLQAYLNFQKADQSEMYAYEDYTKALLKNVSHNSMIFSYQWDYFLSASYYYQFAENYRKDVAVVDKELLRRTWYFNQLNNCYPDLLDDVKTDVDLFVTALTPFERDENYNANLLENLYQRLMTNLVLTRLEKGDVYIGPELFENEMQKGEFKLPDGYTLVPDLFLFKVIKGNEYIPAADPDFLIRFPGRRNYYLNFIEYFTASMLVRRALYEMQFDKPDRAKIYIQKVKIDFPGYNLPKGLEPVLEK